MFPYCETYRLYKRGGAGICCDIDGVSLGPVTLVERVDKGVRKRYCICSAEVLAEALTVAYGPLPGGVMVYLAGGIRRVTQSLEDVNVPLAMIKVVQMKFPEIAPENLSRMATLDLSKYNHRHRPDNGQFDFREGGGGSSRHQAKTTYSGVAIGSASADGSVVQVHLNGFGNTYLDSSFAAKVKDFDKNTSEAGVTLQLPDKRHFYYDPGGNRRQRIHNFNHKVSSLRH
jgi:hypothetical protein